MLEQCFDENTEATPELELHLSTCASCCAKAADLRSLENMLSDLPFEAPEGIEDRVLTAITQEKVRQNRPVLISLLSACILLSATIANWLLPTRTIQTKTWNYLQAWIPNTDWLGSGRPYSEQFTAAWEKAQSLLTNVEWFSSSLIWTSLIATVLLLMVLDGLCALQMRHTNH